MLEFFQNIGNWFVENKNAIMITLSGVDFAGIGTMLYYFFKQKKAISENTSETKLLRKLLKDAEQSNKDMADLKAENTELKNELKEVKSNEESLLMKLNAMLDVQSLVYATIKDEKTRVAVNNILANAKYNENATRNKLYEELELLRQKVVEQSKQLEETVSAGIATSETIINNDKPFVTRQ